MATHETISPSELWQLIQREAAAALAGDPVLGTSATALLDHSDLSSALATLIGQQLGTNQVERTRFTRVATEAFADEPALIEAADLVSEIQPAKHPLQRGIKAQRGIEF